jgi:hypothetical protein
VLSQKIEGFYTGLAARTEEFAMRKSMILLMPLLLAGCVDDTASYQADGHALTVRAEQDYFWKDEVSLKLVASNPPDCQRQFVLGKVPARGLDVELTASDDGVFTLRAGSRLWHVALRNCAELAAPQAPAGEVLGAFRLLDDKLVFIKAGSTVMASR